MLTLQIVRYSEIANLSSIGKIRKLLTMAKSGDIVLLEGRLAKEEEGELIKTTMEEIDDDFKGIEMAVIDNSRKDDNILESAKQGFANLVLGNRTGITLIGPATIIKQIKRDPKKIQVLMEEQKKRRRKKTLVKKGKKRRR